MGPALSGELSTFSTGSRTYPYFTSGDLQSHQAVVFIGGLYCGFLDPAYLIKLSEALGHIGWKLVQMHWSGAYDGFGTGSLDRDRQEMSDLVTHLRANGLEKIIIMGHSTGSQDVIHYLSSSDPVALVEGGIMQAPASDREFFTSETGDTQGWKEQLRIAEELIKEGKGDEIVDKAFCKAIGARMTAYRVHSLVGIGQVMTAPGDDDYFSSDLPWEDDGEHAHPLSASFGKLSAPALVLYSEKDEYGRLPDKTATLKSWEKAANGKLTAKIIEGADHAVTGELERENLCTEVVGWLKSTTK
ncbi:hypothetical protein BCR39DRAFT_578327 [Naematelia encephala]|uniref:Alpha/Beta hydrolase protein n=1 Tax=Naematelia encephala TaxID=71784 RepID=A0A1Y2AWR3_9TREE|nr:hypothetical protein BCR39DRAFT_578327 [Naematelia encephala]